VTVSVASDKLYTMEYRQQYLQLSLEDQEFL